MTEGRRRRERQNKGGKEKGAGRLVARWDKRGHWCPGGPYLLLCSGWDSRKGTMGVCFGSRFRDWAWPGVAGVVHLVAGRELWEAGPLHCQGALLR